jgi:hypothetical protein
MQMPHAGSKEQFGMYFPRTLMRQIWIKGFKGIFVAILSLSFLAMAMPVQAQYHRNDFARGARDGGRGGHYDGHDHRYDNRYDDHDRRSQGGIGPGKGAAIGAAGGAVLGALFGGGLKGALIGGGVGAGVGAIAGKAHQDNQRDQYYNGRRY